MMADCVGSQSLVAKWLTCSELLDLMNKRRISSACPCQFSNKVHFHFKSDNSAPIIFEPFKSDENFCFRRNNSRIMLINAYYNAMRASFSCFSPILCRLTTTYAQARVRHDSQADVYYNPLNGPPLYQYQDYLNSPSHSLLFLYKIPPVIRIFQLYRHETRFPRHPYHGGVKTLQWTQADSFVSVVIHVFRSS